MLEKFKNLFLVVLVLGVLIAVNNATKKPDFVKQTEVKKTEEVKNDISVKRKIVKKNGDVIYEEVKDKSNISRTQSKISKIEQNNKSNNYKVSLGIEYDFNPIKLDFNKQVLANIGLTYQKDLYFVDLKIRSDETVRFSVGVFYEF